MPSKKLNFLDRNLTLWIFAAMAIGVGLGYFDPAFPEAIRTTRTVNPSPWGSIATQQISLQKGRYPPLHKELGAAP